jgi:hypothetical protein
MFEFWIRTRHFELSNMLFWQNLEDPLGKALPFLVFDLAVPELLRE